MTVSLIISLILVGVLLILIEIFITPGIIVGSIGFVLLAIGIYGGYTTFGTTTGNYILAGTSLFLGVALYFSFRDGAWDRFAAKDVIEGKANNMHQVVMEKGERGISISALRPSGTAEINNQRVEVHVNGDFVAANEAIEVLEQRDHKIFVKKVTN
jgi:membrane-bound ClpP family serine protease